MTVAALLFTVSACGSDSGTGIATGDQAAAGATELPSTLDLVATDFTFTNNTGAVAAGPVTVTLRNDGHEAHQVQIGRTRGDVTPEQFIEVFHTQGELGRPSDARLGRRRERHPAGRHGAGDVGARLGQLPDGVLHARRRWCFTHRPQDGRPARGRARRGDAPTPTADQQIKLADYSVTLPAGFTGQGTFEVDNTGQETHELILLRIKDDKTLDDLVAYAAGGNKGTPPYDYAGGVSSIASSTSAWVPLDLKPGSYVAPVRGHEPHDHATACADGDGHAVHDHLIAARPGGVLPRDRRFSPAATR